MQKKDFSIVVTDNSSERARAMRDYISEHSTYGIAGLASDGLSALKLIDECNPDLLVLDMMLPMYDGCEILEHIRNNVATCQSKNYHHISHQDRLFNAQMRTIQHQLLFPKAFQL